MPAGLETYNSDGSIRTSVTDHFGRMLGSTTIDMPAGYLNRFQSGSISDDRLLTGTPFAFFTPFNSPKGGGSHAYCFVSPQIEFMGGTMTWRYVRTAATDFAYNEFGDGPQDGVLYYGVA